MQPKSETKQTSFARSNIKLKKIDIQFLFNGTFCVEFSIFQSSTMLSIRDPEASLIAQ